MIKPKYEIGQYVKAYIGNNVPIEGKIKSVDKRRAPYFYTIAVYGEKKVRETGVWESEILGLTEPNNFVNQWVVPKAELSLAVTNSLGGIKYDQGKNRFSLLIPEFIEEMIKLLEFGAKRHGEFNWQLVEEPRYKDALFRHYLEYIKGNFVDKDSNAHEMVAIAVNAMFIYFLNKKKGEQNAA